MVAVYGALMTKRWVYIVIFVQIWCKALRYLLRGIS